MLLLTATFINVTPKTSNCKDCLVEHHLGLWPSLHDLAEHKTDRIFRQFNLLLTPVGEEFHKQSVSFEDSSSPLFNMYSLPVMTESLFLPGRIPAYLKAPSACSAQAKHGIISSRFALMKFSNHSNQRSDNSSNEKNLFINFAIETISARFARGPPEPSDQSLATQGSQVGIKNLFVGH